MLLPLSAPMAWMAPPARLAHQGHLDPSLNRGLVHRNRRLVPGWKAAMGCRGGEAGTESRGAGSRCGPGGSDSSTASTCTAAPAARVVQVALVAWAAMETPTGTTTAGPAAPAATAATAATAARF